MRLKVQGGQLTHATGWSKGQDLFDQLVQRCSRAAAPLDALVWYQGESDARDESLAASYGARLLSWISDVREALHQPSLPVVVVQVVGVCTQLPHVEVVREQQALAARTASRVVLVDPLDLLLPAPMPGLSVEGAVPDQPAPSVSDLAVCGQRGVGPQRVFRADNLHISLSAQVCLGSALARALARLLIEHEAPRQGVPAAQTRM